MSLAPSTDDSRIKCHKLLSAHVHRMGIPAGGVRSTLPLWQLIWRLLTGLMLHRHCHAPERIVHQHRQVPCEEQLREGCLWVRGLVKQL